MGKGKDYISNRQENVVINGNERWWIKWNRISVGGKLAATAKCTSMAITSSSSSTTLIIIDCLLYINYQLGDIERRAWFLVPTTGLK